MLKPASVTMPDNPTPTVFDNSYRLTSAYEKGYSKNPRDPGGATQDGITQVVYDAFRANSKQEPRDVRSITDDEKRAIYYYQYWQPIKGDQLPVGLSFAVYDFAVNSGPVRAAKELQRILGVAVDGQIGQRTIAAANAAAALGGFEQTITLYCSRRVDFLKSLSTFDEFGNGWTRRVEGKEDGYQKDDNGVIDYAISMAVCDYHAKLPVPQAVGGELQAAVRVLGTTPTPIGTYAGEQAGKGVDASISAIRTTLGRGVVLSLSGLITQTFVHIVTAFEPTFDNRFWLKMFLFGAFAVTAFGVWLMVWHYLRRKAEKSR